MTRIILTSIVTLCIAASGAMAKGHDQGRTDVPGAEDVGTLTVFTAQSLGGSLGERPLGKGPNADNNASGNSGR